MNLLLLSCHLPESIYNNGKGKAQIQKKVKNKQKKPLCDLPFGGHRQDEPVLHYIVSLLPPTSTDQIPALSSGRDLQKPGKKNPKGHPKKEGRRTAP